MNIFGPLSSQAPSLLPATPAPRSTGLLIRRAIAGNENGGESAAQAAASGLLQRVPSLLSSTALTGRQLVLGTVNKAASATQAAASGVLPKVPSLFLVKRTGTQLEQAHAPSPAPTSDPAPSSTPTPAVLPDVSAFEVFRPSASSYNPPPLLVKKPRQLANSFVEKTCELTELVRFETTLSGPLTTLTKKKLLGSGEYHNVYLLVESDKYVLKLCRPEILASEMNSSKTAERWGALLLQYMQVKETKIPCAQIRSFDDILQTDDERRGELDKIIKNPAFHADKLKLLTDWVKKYIPHYALIVQKATDTTTNKLEDYYLQTQPFEVPQPGSFLYAVQQALKAAYEYKGIGGVQGIPIDPKRSNWGKIDGKWTLLDLRDAVVDPDLSDPLLNQILRELTDHPEMAKWLDPRVPESEKRPK
ncbi:MAG: hypothetical protein HY069_01480 [Chlamydiia bacterium]|nr:hypothetical protein [Chlamydiia bacterium]